MDVENAYNLITEKIEGWLIDFVAMLPNLLAAILIVVVSYFLAKLIAKGVGKILNRMHAHAGLSKFLQNLVRFAVLTAGVFIALGVLDLDKTVTSLLAGVGVLGLALGFAFQDTAANFVAGIFLTFKSPFKIDDIVESGSIMGRIKHINLRSTEIQTFRGADVIVPNKDVFQNPITNFSRSGKRRVDISCGISYGDDLEKVKQISLEAMQNVPSISPEMGITFFYTGFGDSSIDFTLRAWSKSIAQPDFLEAQSAMIMALKNAFDAHDIMIPFPIRTLDFGIKGGVPLQPTMIQGME